ncbi:hypothetical protein [Brachybacterium sp. FME24]|uniref:hypothetical protein n=1 Tax=Brachybacterium sp. FME24 TaxID=2742605 RepID=UPI001866D4CF|nr:hypothetical protein [Brachybacterium sp. FME24]
MSTETPQSPAEQTAVFSTLRRAGVSGAESVVVPDVVRAANANPVGFTRALRSLTRFVTPGVGTKPHNASRLLGVLDDISHQLSTPSPELDYLRASADQFVALTEVGVGAAVKAGDTRPLLNATQNAVATVPNRYDTPAAQVAAAVTLGKIHSLHDRDAADLEFSRARELDHARVIRHFYVDMGAMTYFSDATISSTDATADIASVHDSLRPYDAAEPGARTSLVISVDPRFYRIYAPLLYFYAQQLPDLDFSILICADRGRAKELITDGRRYMNALRTLNRSGRMTNVHHYVLPVPRFVAEAKTFYACARFLAAPRLLEKYENLYLMDADLTVDTHPKAFLASVSELPFAAPRTGGEAALSPWRRYMAGNIPLHRKVLDTPVLDDVQRYLAVGLRSRSSWMLDQNALAYAIERSPSSYTNLNEYSRPFRAPSFKVTWEQNYQA